MTATNLQQGLKLHRAGRLDDAVAVYGRILRVDPRQADAWHLAGLCAVQQGNPAAGVESLRRAVSLKPDSAVFHTSLGSALTGCGEAGEARRHFERAIALNPEAMEARYNVANLLRSLGEFEAAIARYEQALQLRPGHPDILNNLATTLKDAGRLEAAEQRYREALRANERHVDAAVNLGRLLAESGAVPEAAGVLRRTISIVAPAVEPRVRLAECLCDIGCLDEATDTLTDVVRTHPDSADAWTALGNIHKDCDRLDEAVDCYRRAIAVAPACIAAWNNLGNALKLQQKLDEAAQHYQRVLKLQPDFEPALANLAAVRQTQGRTSAARRYWTRANALRADPVREFQLATLLPPIYRSQSHMQECREQMLAGVERLQQRGVVIDPAKRLIPTLFYTAYQGFDDRALMQAAATLCESSFDYRRFRRSGNDGRIRVGILSAFLGEHTIGRLTHGLIRHLSRERFHVTVLSPLLPRDVLADFVHPADELVELGRQLPVALQRAAAASLDVLFYPDVGMDPLTSTMARTRLAPAQCVTWGHPVTTGIPGMDAFLSSRLLETADAAAHYTERLELLDALPACYRAPEGEKARLLLEHRGQALLQESPELGTRIKKPGFCAEFGLPDDRSVYLCPQSLFKLHPEFDGLLAELLDRDRRGILALVEPLTPHWKTLLLERWSETLGRHLDRVRFVNRMNRGPFLRLLQTADVMLDPLHFGGGNTNYEALGLGVPIVTLPSQFLRGRVALGMYRRIGVEACVARSHTEYVDLAFRIANDGGFGRFVRQRIGERSAGLFADREAVGEFERAIERCARMSR